jgi:hypothetical protein
MRVVSVGAAAGWSVFVAGPPKLVREQADRRRARRNDGEGDQDVKEQKILQFTYDNSP